MIDIDWCGEETVGCSDRHRLSCIRTEMTKSCTAPETGSMAEAEEDRTEGKTKMLPAKSCHTHSLTHACQHTNASRIETNKKEKGCTTRRTAPKEENNATL